VTILTIGFGDLFPTETVGRALLIPYSIGGIIMLGLMIGAIYKSVQELGEKNIIRHHFEQQREQTRKTTVRSSLELHRREIEEQLARERAAAKQAARGSARSPATGVMYQATAETRRGSVSDVDAALGSRLSRTNTLQTAIKKKRKRIVLLKEEKERFEAMRTIQKKAHSWQNWYRLTVTLLIFAIFWLVGAVFFWQAEKSTLGMSYWETIYFCWVSLLSIGYGDFSPHSGAGRCFFVIWSLMAVPTMTILAGDLTSTVVSLFSSWSLAVANLTVLPTYGVWHDLVEKHPWLLLHLPRVIERVVRAHAAKGQSPERLGEKGYDGDRSSSTAEDPKDEQYASGNLKPDIEGIIDQQDADKVKQPDATALVRQLALAIQRTAQDMTSEAAREYTYEEWVEFTRLIRFSAVGGPADALLEEDEEGMVDWDWIGDDSPMNSQQSEPQFVHDRLCESLVRYLRRNPPVTTFAQSLKERGETALRLRGVSGVDDEDDENLCISGSTSFVSRDAASVRSRKGSFVNIASTLREGEDGGRGTNLHSVEEEDHEHHEAR